MPHKNLNERAAAIRFENIQAGAEVSMKSTEKTAGGAKGLYHNSLPIQA
jgi:hypothetical protein